MKKIFLNSSDNKFRIDCYTPFIKANDIAVVIFPGGAYVGLAEHEGEGYARLLNTFGITSFVVWYSVYPERFPTQLKEARSAISYIRKNAKKYGINKNKIIAMGSSAGGHLAALLSTYRGDLEDDTGEYADEDYLPNGQILCYPVISSDETISHKASFQRLLGEEYVQKKDLISPELSVNDKTPPAFIWHTEKDEGVSVFNSFRYAEALIKNKVSCELHIFPDGPHGMGIASDSPVVSQWTDLLKKWLINNY